MNEVIELLKSGSKTNFQLALILAKSQGWNIDPKGLKKLLNSDLTGQYFWEDFPSSVAKLLATEEIEIPQPYSSNLEVLKINYLPKEFGLLREVKKIEIYDAHLKQLPEEICELKKLESITVENTKLKSIPKSIGNLPNLKFVEFRNNKSITSIPEGNVQ